MMRHFTHLLFAVAVICFAVVAGYAQTPDASRLYLTVDDHQGNSAVMVYGNAVNATYYIDDGNGGTTNYFESISPPRPPDPCFDARWRGIPGRVNTPIVDGFGPRDYRPVPTNPARKDTFLINFYNSIIGGSESMWFTWDDPATLALHCDSAFFVYNDGSGNVTINMFTQSSLEMIAVGDNAITQARIYKYGSNIIDGVNDNPGQPVEFGLKNNYPNPFNPSTQIQFDLAKSSAVDLSIYNVLGQKIATLVTGQVGIGSHTAVWKGTTEYGAPVSSGVYFARLNARVDGTGEVFTALRKLLLMK